MVKPPSIRSLGLHAAFIVIALPAAMFLISLVLGAIIASIESWDYHDGILYIGGDLVLVTLTGVVPTTEAGTVFDMFISCVALGLLAWVFAVTGLLPVCGTTCQIIGGTHTYARTSLGLGLMFFVMLPAIILCLSIILALPLMAIEGWSFKLSFETCAGVLAHAHGMTGGVVGPMSEFGRIFALYASFNAMSVVLGLVVGVYVALPFTGKVADFLSKPVSSKGLMAKFIHFVVCAGILAPMFLLPVVAVLGAVLAAVEDWDSTMDGILYVGGSMVLLPLTPVVPTTVGGKAFDYLVSCFGIGVFGLVLAIIGAVPFVDASCEKLGGKSDRKLVASCFTLFFFLILMPIACMLWAMPLGGLLAAGESWSFVDGWLFALSVLVQAPSVAPAAAVPQTEGGQLLVFIVAVHALCLTLGWGAGIIVPSSSLDAGNKVINRLFLIAEEAADEAVNDVDAEAGAAEADAKETAKGVDAEAGAAEVDVKQAADKQAEANKNQTDASAEGGAQRGGTSAEVTESPEENKATEEKNV